MAQGEALGPSGPPLGYASDSVHTVFNLRKKTHVREITRHTRFVHRYEHLSVWQTGAGYRS